VTSPLNDQPNSLHKLMPRLENRSLAGVGHWLHMDDSASFNRTLLRLITQIDGSTRPESELR
jgi:pimeloyl-ACP methyl ester carboxylesterase